jgi:hypothetical protein
MSSGCGLAQPMIVPFLWGAGLAFAVVSAFAPLPQRQAWDWGVLAAVSFTALAPLTAVEGDETACCIAVLCALLGWALWALGRKGVL